MILTNQLWILDFGTPHSGEPAFQRPGLIVGPPDFFGASFPFVFVVPLTTTHRQLSTHVEVEPTQKSGLKKVSYIQCEQLRSVNKERAVSYLGIVDILVAEKVSDTIKMLLNY